MKMLRGRAIEVTVDSASLAREIKKNPMEAFEKYPSLEYRMLCLQELRNFEYFDFSSYAKWAEEIIPFLACSEDLIAGELISWYLFNSTDKRGALKFIIDETRYTLHKKAKIVCNCFLHNRANIYESYENMFFLKDFLNDLLNELKNSQEEKYAERIWLCAKHAIDVILDVEDYSFIPKIEEIIEMLRNGKIGPNRRCFHGRVDFVARIHLATLEFAIEILNAAKKKSEKTEEKLKEK